MISKSRYPSFILIHNGAFHFHHGTSWREFSHSFSIIPMPTKKFKCWFTLSRGIIYSFFHYKFFEKDENGNSLNLQHQQSLCEPDWIFQRMKINFRCFSKNKCCSVLYYINMLRRFIQVFGNLQQRHWNSRSHLVWMQLDTWHITDINLNMFKCHSYPNFIIVIHRHVDISSIYW